MTNLIIWTGNTLIGGVDVWVKELKTLLEGSRYDLITISDGHIFAGSEKVDICVNSWGRCEKALKRLSPAVVMPNWMHPLTGICAKLNKGGAKLRCLGMPHSDSDREYYDPLVWYGSGISKFVAGSPYCRDKLAARFPGRVNDISHIPYGITIPSEGPEKKYSLRPLKLAYFGRIEQKQKNVFDLAALAALLDDKGVDYSLDIIGSGPDKRELASKFAGSKRVRLSGQVPHREILAALTGYDAFVQVSKYEGFGLSMIEAMVRKIIPCVTKASGGASYLINNGMNGFTVDIGDMGAMASVLKRISCMGPGEATAIGSGAYRTAAGNCDIGRTSVEFMKVLDACMDSPGREWSRGGTYMMPGGWSSDYFRLWKKLTW
ncbi:MAG: glycosyltransferase family 4 protein [Candidatus Omnitrophota bacterium]|jgi:glycosyltransferase involved in cell wall biosynthesis